MIIAEIPKAKHCSFFCYLLTIDVCIINVWGYTEILPILGSFSNDDGDGNQAVKKATGLLQQLCTCITLFCTFLHRPCTTTT